MKLFLLIFVTFLALPLLQGVKKCSKIDACRCSTDEGEINLWSLVGENHKPRFSFPEVSANYTPGQTNDSYQWNPCDSWTAKTSPNETTKNDCKEVAVCLTQQVPIFGTFHNNIGQHNLSDCVLDQKNGRCVLTYGVTSNKQIKTSISLVCDETEEGKVDAMMSMFRSRYNTTLHSKCACPGKCSDSSNGLSTGEIVGIVVGSVAGVVFLAFVVFIGYLRSKMPDGTPKPSTCATIKVGFGMIIAKCCPCCKRPQYSEYSPIPGSTIQN